MKDPKINFEIDKAIKFLAVEYVKSGKNPKPVVLHSIRVGLYLYNQEYNKEIVLAGVLHDLLEDSAVTFSQIKKNFGAEIARLVLANSYNKIKDRDKRFKELFSRCKKAGKAALIVKAADIIDNSDYYNLLDKDRYDWLIMKMEYFINFSKSILAKEIVWKQLRKRLNELKKTK